VDSGAGLDGMRKGLYAMAVKERPAGSPEAAPWPGCDQVDQASQPEAGTPKTAKPKTAAAPSQYQQMAEMVFKANDKNQDGKLVRDEMKAMIESTNAAARAKGEQEVDFFHQVDSDGDGVLTKDEMLAYFKKMLQGAGDAAAGSKPAGGASPKATGASKTSGGAAPDLQQLQNQFFDKLDADGDGALSRDEMRSVIEKTNMQAANQGAGESGDDFFNTLDRDGDGSISRKEAEAFFAAANGMLSGASKDEL